MSRAYTDEGVEFHTYHGEGGDSPCVDVPGNLHTGCGNPETYQAHRCVWCGELFDYNQCPNMRDLCTECCGED